MGYNAATRTFDILSDLRGQRGTSNAKVILQGFSSIGDGGGGEFYWDSTSTEPDNVGTVIAPSIGSGAGRWKRNFNGAVNVKWFGAIADGTTDNTTIIQNALNVSQQHGTNEIYIGSESASFVIGTVNVPSGMSIKSNGAIIKPTSTGQGFVIDNQSFVEMAGLEFDGSSQLTGEIYCIHVINGSSHLKFADCYFRDGRYGLHIISANDVNITGCTFTNFRAWGNYLVNISGLKLIGNTSYNNINDGFKVAGLDLPSTQQLIQNVIIIGNISYNNGQDGMDFAVNQIDGVIISGNEFYNNALYGLTFKSVYQSSSTKNIIITDNIYKDNGAGGLNSQWIGAAPINMRISKNIIYSSLNVNSGLRIQDVDAGTEVHDNTIYGYQYGIRIINSSNVRVYSNTCNNNTRNIFVETQPKSDGSAGVSTGVNIYFNKLKGTATPIYIQDNTGLNSPVTAVNIHDNDYSENTNASFKVAVGDGSSTYVSYMNIMGITNAKPTGRGLAGDIYLNTDITLTNCIGWRALNSSGTATWDAYGITETGGRDKIFTATTTNATTATGFTLAVPTNSVGSYDIDVLVKDTTTNKSGVFKKYGLARNDTGTATIISQEDVITTAYDSELTGIAIIFDATGGSIRIRITGLASTTLSWKFFVRANTI